MRRCGIILFLDGDGADRADLAGMLVAPIRAGTHDFVIGSRVRGEREPGSMNWHQVLAGRLAGRLMSMLYGVRYTDMCAFRAIRRDALDRLGLREATYGWNIEMQMKAARAGLRILELPVPYQAPRRRQFEGRGFAARQRPCCLAHHPDHCSGRDGRSLNAASSEISVGRSAILPLPLREGGWGRGSSSTRQSGGSPLPKTPPPTPSPARGGGGPMPKKR